MQVNLVLVLVFVQLTAALHEGGIIAGGNGVDPLTQFHNLIREAIRYMHNSKEQPAKLSSGSQIVKVRNPRSEIGDVALKLYHLQEMDRKYGAKARPRFGKRFEVTQDNFIPMYEEETP